jgi:hypothetical protein
VALAGSDLYVAVSSSPQSSAWWYTPLLSGIFALTGVLIAQLIVLYLARRNDNRRSEPELLKHCATFSAACGELKREFALKRPEERNLSSISQLESSYDAIEIIGTPEIEMAAERFIGIVPLIFHYEKHDDKNGLEESKSQLFQAHMQFVAAVRAHFNRPEKIHRAVPMIEIPQPWVGSGSRRHRWDSLRKSKPTSGARTGQTP